MTIKPDDDKKEKITELRDTMATLLWDIWSMFPVTKREDISQEEFENTLM
jgi:hypothetical protein